MTNISQTLLKDFDILWQSVEQLQQAIGYSYIEAIGETLQNLVNNQDVQQIEGVPTDDVVKILKNNYEKLNITDKSSDTIRQLVQYAFLKATQLEALQSNHHLTPESVSLLVAFMVNALSGSMKQVAVADFAVGSGNLLASVTNFLKQSQKQVDTYAIDNDDVLIHLASQSFELQQLKGRFIFQDAIQPIYLPLMDIVISDLPVGYYPIDDHAKGYLVQVEDEHTYSHHLLIEKHIELLKDNGFGVFVVPSTIFETEQGGILLNYLQRQTFIQAMLNLPEHMFTQKKQQKAILIVQKQGDRAKQAKQVLLGDIPNFKILDKFKQFTEVFQQWASDLFI